ncbi:MAG TPA: hypothetical protein VHX66_15260 [Solirubrobacteraceae bacterium]|jgi:hypothetical protein|nr:hypothetical protein [Solirubrobacteraceae bacterium]
MSRRFARRALRLPAIAAFVLTPAALAANAHGGASYSGTLAGANHIAITLRVAANARAVVAVKIAGLPIYCSGNAPPGTPTLAFPRTTISRSGKFTATGQDMIGSGPLKGSVAATFKISGTFTANGREHGTITTRYSGAAKSCSGSSAYSTRASA